MYARISLILLIVSMACITVQNAPYFAHGHFLHVLPMLAVCWVGWNMLKEDGPPAPRTVFWTLAFTAVASAELALGIYKHKPFDENGVFTLLSFSQLLLTAFTSLAVWRIRRAPGRLSISDESSIWAIIAAGFFYLSADEEILLHEGAGHSFHKILGLAETAWSSRLDDMLVGIYGIIGIVVLWRYRKEILRLPLFFRLLKWGFALLFLSVAADALSHKPDFFAWLLGDKWGTLACDLGEDMDEICKVAAEVFFLTAFSSALGSARVEARQGHGQT